MVFFMLDSLVTPFQLNRKNLDHLSHVGLRGCRFFMHSCFGSRCRQFDEVQLHSQVHRHVQGHPKLTFKQFKQQLPSFQLVKSILLASFQFVIIRQVIRLASNHCHAGPPFFDAPKVCSGHGLNSSSSPKM